MSLQYTINKAHEKSKILIFCSLYASLNRRHNINLNRVWEHRFCGDLWSVGCGFNSHLGHVVVSLGMTLCDNFLCLMDSDK